MLVSLVLLAQANISPPPVELNHFFITVDQRTWNVIRSSKWVRDTFGQVSEGTFSDGKDTWTGFYVMGVGSYVEIFAPHGPFKEGDGGLALLTTTPGGADTLDYLFRKGYFGNRSRRELMSLSSASGMSPFAHILDYVGNKSNLSYWVMEYHELQYDRVGVPVGSSHAAMSAARRKQRGQTIISREVF